MNLGTNWTGGFRVWRGELSPVPKKSLCRFTSRFWEYFSISEYTLLVIWEGEAHPSLPLTSPMFHANVPRYSTQVPNSNLVSRTFHTTITASHIHPILKLTLRCLKQPTVIYAQVTECVYYVTGPVVLELFYLIKG